MQPIDYLAESVEVKDLIEKQIRGSRVQVTKGPAKGHYGLVLEVKELQPLGLFGVQKVIHLAKIELENGYQFVPIGGKPENFVEVPVEDLVFNAGPTEGVKVKAICVCDIRDLMTNGCQCGEKSLEP